VLTTGGYFLVKDYTFRPLDLWEFGLHGGVEHDASLVHHDTPEGNSIAPIEIDHEWADNLRGDILPKVGHESGEDKEYRAVVNATDVARMRVRREKETLRPLDAVHAEIARGEVAIALGVWETETILPGGEKKMGIPLEWFLDWLKYEKLPEGWKPDHVQGLMDVVKRSKEIREAAEEMRKSGDTMKEK
jgi:hypothetical protein